MQSGPYPYPFEIPPQLPQAGGNLLHYWSQLKRGGNNVPFSDDLNLPALPEYSDRLFLMDAFDRPLRFRFNLLGQKIADVYGAAVTGQFLDEIARKTPFELLAAQASVAVEAQIPTYYAWEAGGPGKPVGYSRLVLPMWGNGRIDLLLGLLILR